ncbi:MAG: 2-phosphosulfolactate phosphatase, partial [Pseudanabaena sp. RU_4_16]|nr:2-phosphosulfolactate phosphatase [Pseudanabaena sp. RU_4_16]
MKLSVYHTPELTPDNEIPECAIAVDILRATTTITTALAAG